VLVLRRGFQNLLALCQVPKNFDDLIELFYRHSSKAPERPLVLLSPDIQECWHLVLKKTHCHDVEDELSSLDLSFSALDIFIQ